MDEFKQTIITVLKSLNRPIPFYITNDELMPLVSAYWKTNGISGLSISSVAIGRALKQLGYKHRRTTMVRGWIISHF